MAYNKYYQEELQNLRELGAEFARVHPALAPLLSGPSADPDVERLLEGVAFLTGLIRRKLDDDFPEIIHSLTDLIFPHYLRPIPATTVVAFRPKPNLQETLRIPAGTALASVPVDGTECRFRTCTDLEVHPLRLTAAELIQQPGQRDRIRLALQLSGPDLSRWSVKRLRLYLGDEYSQATDLFMHLTRHVRRITLHPVAGGSDRALPPTALRPVGFDLANSLLAFPSQAFRGFRLLQEYFVLPQKFLFLDLDGFDGWTDRGKGNAFEIHFELTSAPVPPPKVRPEHFVLFAAPVINLFAQDAEPVLLDHRTDKIRIRPSAKDPSHVQVYSVDRVEGFVQGSVARREYVPLELFSQHQADRPVYQILRSQSPVTDLPEVALALTYPVESPEPVTETLSMALTCTNGALPERLQLGDICRPTSSTPELVTFQNILPPTSPIQPALEENALWRFLSHLSLNYLSIANVDNLKEMLRLYIFPGRDRTRIASNLKRVEGILDLKVTPSDRLVSGLPMRGQAIQLSARQDHFAGLGDFFLFGSLLDLFLGVYSSMNSFIRFSMKDTVTGETYTWPTRIGDRSLT
jgi:type VI secretion system protein ImpG